MSKARNSCGRATTLLSIHNSTQIDKDEFPGRFEVLAGTEAQLDESILKVWARAADDSR